MRGGGSSTTEELGLADEPPEIPAETFIDRFLVEARVGSGGMGVVYRAFDPLLDRRVAVKLLRTGSDLLAHEAKALGRLSHPNVCAVYDVGSYRDQLFIAMELIDGEQLAAHLRGVREPRAILDLFIQAGRGLEAAHAAGVVHADFKPTNVLVGKDGRVRVVDFGLARRGAEQPAVAGSPSGPLSTLGGATAGTPRYMAPEQHRGQRPTEKSDQFTFCLALWEALFGALPFHGHVDDWGPLPAPPRGRVPARVRDALARGLELDPERRWPSMTALLARLAHRASGRRALLGAGLVLATGLALGFAVRGRPDPCAGIAARAAEAWGPARRDAVRRAFLARDAGDAFRAAARMLDDYAAAWRAEEASACRVEGEAGLPRSACLEQRLADLRGLGAALETPGEELVRHAPDVAAALEGVAACGAAASLQLPVPQAAGLRAQVIALTARVDTWGALALHGAPPPREDRIEDLIAAAAALGYRPLQARAALVRGQDLLGREEHAAAEKALTEALMLAEEGRALAVQIAAWKDLGNVLGRQKRFAESHAAARHAEALLRSLGPEGDPLRADLDAAEGLTFALENEPAEARALLERALAAIRRARGPDSWREAAVEASLAWHLWINVGDLAAAEMHDRHALAIYHAFGSMPLTAADILDNLGCLTALQGRPIEALRSFEEALALKARLLPPDVASVGETEFNYGLTFHHLRRFAEGEPHLRRAHDILVGKLHREDPTAIEDEALLGVAVALGGRRLAEARPLLERALAADARTPALDDEERALARFALALALDAERAGAGRALAEQALAKLTAPGDVEQVRELLGGR